jgi:hypothetical protein
MKQKQQRRKDLLSCGRDQIQALGFQPGIIDMRFHLGLWGSGPCYSTTATVDQPM